MSLVNLAHVCSHLQNASKARLGLTSIPYTKLHASVSNQLLKAGFVSSVTLGGPQPPGGEPSPILGHYHLPEEEATITQENRASRRLWLSLKYWDNRPVITSMKMVSKPTRRVWCGAQDLARLSTGKQAGYIEGLRQVGECMLLSTDQGIMELREALQRGIGGQLLFRIY